MIISRLLVAYITLTLGLTGAAEASDQDCYDLKVRAKAVAQIPTVYPRDEDPNVIIMSWPWFLDLKIQRVLDGDTKQTTVTALAVMHVRYVKRNLTWLLRRNAAGGFNVVRSDQPDQVRRCDSAVPPAKPYITPAPGSTYDDLRREGEEAYRRLGGDI